MSLHALADHMAARGRGPDTTLVHMAPQEVAGLQSLAMAHGGSLTINPTTGLPEAGFLSNLLPTLIGAGLSIASGGALTPLMAAGITGAGYGVASGSLQKGLMAGLGAYGGAGLGSGLSAAGAAQASVPGAAPVSAEGLAPFSTNAADYTKFAPTESSFGAFGGAKGALASAPTGGSSLFGTATDVAGQPLSFEAAVPAPTTPMAAPAPAAAPTATAPAYGTESARNAFQSKAADATMTDNFKQAGRGLKSLVDSPAGRDAFLGTAAKDGVEATGVGGLSGLAKYGTAAIANPLLTPPSGSGYKSDSEQYKYEYDVGRNPDPQGSYTGAPTGERQWFAPKFTRLYAEGGKTQTSEEARNYLMSTDPTGRTNDLTGASRQAYDYLMGNGPGYRPQIQTKSFLPEARILDDAGNVTSSPSIGGGITTLPTVSTSTTPDTYDQEGQNAINKIEEEVAQEQYDQEGQDAINKYEREFEEPRYDQEGQDAINKIEQEVADENAYNESLNDDELGYLRDNNPYTPAQDETTSVNPTPDSVLNQDEFGDLQGAIERNMSPAQDDGMTDVVQNQVLAQEDPYGKLDDAIAANNLSDSALASDIDNSTIAVDNYDTYSGFKPEPANLAIPVENRSPVVETPDGGAYVEVGNAGGDFGGRMIDAESDGNSIDEDEYDYQGMARGGMTPYSYAMGGGLSSLGGYSDGGRLLKGPGDGVSDSIPAMIGKKQPARLADGEFVIPARIVSELGNGSTEAGARKLYKMMDRIQAARKKTTGKNRVAVNSRADKMMPV